ncbi:MAG TPA: hypothetical protein VGK36_20680 [Candidatus Angelobacter sp.]|jgi:hypothetical protein
MDDPILAPFKDMYEVNRGQYGLGPLPKNAKVFIDRADWSESGYDAMLKLYAKSNHWVAFRLEGGRYKWIGELEQCSGPQKYRSADGLLNEQVDISYFQHVPLHYDGLRITYVGPDSHTDLDIPLAKAKQLLKTWGCS